MMQDMNQIILFNLSQNETYKFMLRLPVYLTLADLAYLSETVPAFTSIGAGSVDTAGIIWTFISLSGTLVNICQKFK